jgi:hypothetical protein
VLIDSCIYYSQNFLFCKKWERFFDFLFAIGGKMYTVRLPIVQKEESFFVFDILYKKDKHSMCGLILWKYQNFLGLLAPTS